MRQRKESVYYTAVIATSLWHTDEEWPKGGRHQASEKSTKGRRETKKHPLLARGLAHNLFPY
jgi:hypothetical protein